MSKIPSVPISFGGQTRHLIFDFNALAELQDLGGTYQSDVAHLKAMRAFVWAGLLSETLDKRGRETSRTLSLLEVGNIINDMSPEEIASLVTSIQEARGISDPDPNSQAATPKS